jgi:hypothetical protein
LETAALVSATTHDARSATALSTSRVIGVDLSGFLTSFTYVFKALYSSPIARSPRQKEQGIHQHPIAKSAGSFNTAAQRRTKKTGQQHNGDQRSGTYHPQQALKY